MNSSGSQSQQPHIRKSVNWQNTMQNQRQNSLIITQICKVLSNSEVNVQNISSFKQNTLLKLRIIQQKPPYLADNTTCIQALIKKTPQIKLDPFNSFATDYYHAHSKPQVLFNCHDSTIQNENQEEIRFPSAYHPAYHYKNNYLNFKQKKKIIKVLVSCQTLQIKCWSVAIVNISCSGYYAPILLIHEFRKIHQTFILDHLVQNILFSKQIKPYLQRFRLIDIRKCLKQKQKETNPISFTFYMRNQNIMKKNSKISQYASLDIKGLTLPYNDKIPVNFIPLGSVKQYQIFKRPVPPKYVTKKRYINLQNLNLQVQRQIQSLEEANSSFGSSQSQEYVTNRMEQNNFEQQMENRRTRNYANSNRMQDQYQFDDESEDHSEDQDYLKKIYAKRMQENKQTII